jgi:hypothetical protein
MSFLSLLDPTAYSEIVSEVSDSWDRIKSSAADAEVFGATLYRR